MKTRTSSVYYLVSFNAKTIQLNSKQPMTIGREKYNDLIINDLLVSRQHAMIKWENNKFVIKDLSSRNGTYINNKRIDSVVLKDNDVIKIGNYESTVREAAKTDVEKLLLKERGKMSSQKTVVDTDLGLKFDDTGFSGNLTSLSLVEVVQTLSQCLKTGVLTVKYRIDCDKSSHLYFDDGNLVHAEYERQQGNSAVFSILRLADGKFKFINDVQAPKQTINDTTMGILLEACKKQDEAHRQDTHN